MLTRSFLLQLFLFLALALVGCGGPDGPEGYNHAGVRHFEEGRLEEAMTAYDEAIRLNPEFAAAYFNRGQTHFSLGAADRAIEDFNVAIELSPGHPQVPLAHAARAMAYTLLGKDEEAQQDIMRAVQLGYDYRRLVVLINGIKDQR